MFSPSSPASVVPFFCLFSTPSKLHPLPIPFYVLPHLQSVSSLHKLGAGVHAHTHTHPTLCFVGQEWSMALGAVLWPHKLHSNHKRFACAGKFQVAVFE